MILSIILSIILSLANSTPMQDRQSDVKC
ncbi:hypothetical protein WKC_04822 [Escherichia coli KTE157]|nr:hypothetical protein WKC_04822 [Escherichia coli KTE157]